MRCILGAGARPANRAAPRARALPPEPSPPPTSTRGRGVRAAGARRGAPLPWAGPRLPARPPPAARRPTRGRLRPERVVCGRVPSGAGRPAGLEVPATPRSARPPRSRPPLTQPRAAGTGRGRGRSPLGGQPSFRSRWSAPPPLCRVGTSQQRCSVWSLEGRSVRGPRNPPFLPSLFQRSHQLQLLETLFCSELTPTYA